MFIILGFARAVAELFSRPQVDFEQLKRWRAAAEEGRVQAQYRLGRAYYFGIRVAQDKMEAMRWFHKAAAQGHTEAQYRLGRGYDKGDGIIFKNQKRAVHWYRAGAEKGHPYAQFQLGAAYVRGKGVDMDRAEGYKWMLLSAERADDRELADMIMDTVRMVEDLLTANEKKLGTEGADAWRAQFAAAKKEGA